MGTECFKWEKERKEFVRLNNIASAGRSVDKQPKKKRRRRSRSRRAVAKKRKQRMLRHQKLSRYLRLICQNNKSFINFKGHAVLGSASNRKQEVTAQRQAPRRPHQRKRTTRQSSLNFQLAICHCVTGRRERERADKTANRKRHPAPAGTRQSVCQQNVIIFFGNTIIIIRRKKYLNHVRAQWHF